MNKWRRSQKKGISYSVGAVMKKWNHGLAVMVGTWINSMIQMTMDMGMGMAVIKRRSGSCMWHHFLFVSTANTVGSIMVEVQVEILKSCTDMHALL